MKNKKLRVVVTGASGMVGEGVMHEALHHPDVSEVIVVGRRTCGTSHPRLREVLIREFNETEISSIREQLTDIDAFFFCLGVTSLGKKEPEYTQLTYDLTMAFAGVSAQASPGSTFIYVSGAGTDSTEQGRVMWARVKGKTENDLRRLGFGQAIAFRPGYIHPTPGLLHPHPMYRYVAWAYPLFNRFFSAYTSTLREVGLAMIHTARIGSDKQVMEVPDINRAAALEEDYLIHPPAQPDSDSSAAQATIHSSGILPDRDIKKNLGCG